MSIRLTIPGVPPQKNAKHKLFAKPAGRGKYAVGRTNSPQFKRFCDVVLLAWDRVRAHGRTKPALAGAWAIEVRAYWDRQRHLDMAFGIGDVDAPVECVLDALEHCGAIDNDTRIVRLVATKHVDRDNPRIEVDLELLALAPQVDLIPPGVYDF